MTERLAGKVALITGAASGIGQQMCVVFAEQGAVVAALDRNEEGLAETSRLVAESGGLMQPITCDVSSEADVRCAVDAALHKCERLDIVVNNAGIIPYGRDTDVIHLDRATWDEVMAVNATSMYLVAKYAAPTLIQQGSGSIVNVSSVSAVTGEIDEPLDGYAASKGAVLGLTKSMAVWLAKHNVRVNAVLPGLCRTPVQDYLFENQETVDLCMTLIPLQRAASPREIANVALFLASDDATYVTGAEFVVDGGFLSM